MKESLLPSYGSEARALGLKTSKFTFIFYLFFFFDGMRYDKGFD